MPESRVGGLARSLRRRKKPDEPPRFKWKIALLGDHEVGKTSLVRRYVLDQVPDAYIRAVGAKVMKKDLAFRSPKARGSLLLWDILGERWLDERRLAALLKGTRGVLFVYDVTRHETLDNLESYWIPIVREAVGRVPAIRIGIAANKIDRAASRKDEEVLLADLTRSYEAPGTVTSAKTGAGVERSFRSLGEAILRAVA